MSGNLRAISQPMALSAADRERFLAAALAAARRAGAIQRRHFRSPGLAVEHKTDASPVTVADRDSEAAIRETLRAATPELGLAGEESPPEGDPRDRWIIDPIDGTKNFVAGLPFFAVLIALELDGELVLGAVHAPVLGTGSPDSDGVAGLAEEALGETWWAARGAGAFAGPGTASARHRRRLRVSATADLDCAFLTHGGLRRIQQGGFWERFSAVVAEVGRTRGFGDWWGHMLVAEGRCDAMFEAAIALHDVAAIKVIVEEAGGAFRTRGNAPLDAAFHEAVLSSNAVLAEVLAERLGM